VFYVLNDIQRNRDDQIRLEDHIEEIRDKYQKDNDSFDRIIDWQGVYKNPPDTLPLYTTRQRLKDQVFFDTWKPLLEDIQNIQKVVTKAYKRLWNSF
jgi:hypothetical protein